MIKTINITPLNTTKELFYKCDNCGKEGTIVLENSIIDTDNTGNPTRPLDYECPECNKKL